MSDWQDIRIRAIAHGESIKSIKRHGVPRVITIDKSEANTAAIESYNAEQKTNIKIRQCKYLNNIVE